MGRARSYVIAAVCVGATWVFTPSAALAALGDCGQPLTEGANATASDCLFLLRVSVGSDACDTPCICDLDRSGATVASDALLCLRIAVGAPAEATCFCPYARINVNIAGAGASPMSPDEIAGAPGVRDDQWNNLSGTANGGGPVDLVDGDGSAVDGATAGYTRIGQGTLSEGGGTDDGHMFSSLIDAYDYPAYEIDVAGIPYPRYDVYVYHQGGAPAGLSRVARFVIGDAELFARRPEHFLYTQSHATSDQGPTTAVGSFVVFRDLTTPSFTLTLGGASASDGFRRVRFSGFQVVGVEPKL